MRRFGLFAHRHTGRIVHRGDVSHRLLLSMMEPPSVGYGAGGVYRRVCAFSAPPCAIFRFGSRCNFRGRRSFSRDTALYIAQGRRVRKHKWGLLEAPRIENGTHPATVLHRALRIASRSTRAYRNSDTLICGRHQEKGLYCAHRNMREPSRPIYHYVVTY